MATIVQNHAPGRASIEVTASCRGCGCESTVSWQHGQGTTITEALETLGYRGWGKAGGLWHCADCLPEAKRESRRQARAVGATTLARKRKIIA